MMACFLCFGAGCDAGGELEVGAGRLTGTELDWAGVVIGKV